MQPCDWSPSVSAPPCWSPWWSAPVSRPQRLSPGDVGLQLLENATATPSDSRVLILMFGPVCGAHFNPVVSAGRLVDRRRVGAGPWREVVAYLPAQIAGCVRGRRLANLMFDQAP